MKRPRAARELAITTWAVAGVALMLGEAVVRMGTRTLHLLRDGLAPPAWAALVVVVALFCYGEGYHALQKRFVPRVVARAVAFAETASGCLPLLGAPLFALGLVGASRRELLRAWLGVILIVVAIMGVRTLPSPWRAIVDAGVTAALAWGLVALVVALARIVVNGTGQLGFRC